MYLVVIEGDHVPGSSGHGHELHDELLGLEVQHLLVEGTLGKTSLAEKILNTLRRKVSIGKGAELL